MKIGWKTITGAIVTGIGVLSQPDVFALLPHAVASVVTVVGGVLGAIGLRVAIAKQGQ